MRRIHSTSIALLAVCTVLNLINFLNISANQISNRKLGMQEAYISTNERKIISTGFSTVKSFDVHSLNDLISNSEPELNELKLWTDKNEYNIGEKVVIILENRGNATIYLPNSAPWIIMDDDGKIIYAPIAIQVITPVKPKSAKYWSWDQIDNKGKQIKPGTYTVFLKTIDGRILTAKIGVVSDQGKYEETLSPQQSAIIMILIVVTTIGIANIIHSIKQT
ncbi:MAG: hypothetical protein NDF55_01030 [archaeon GB-1867-005]|nr:hypothetical protein [Candidatus Culexmicrobium cathedralense]